MSAQHTPQTIHAVDQLADDYRTYCGLPLGCNYPTSRTPNLALANCPQCRAEALAREVELSMLCDHPPWDDSWYNRDTVPCRRCGRAVLVA